MASLRCSQCGTDWPQDFARFKDCPECQKRTWYSVKGEPIDESEARHRLFEVFWQEKERALRDQIDAIPVPVEDVAKMSGMGE